MTAPHVVTPADLPAPYAGPPLRIAYVGNFRHPWCTEVHVAASLELLGHHVQRLQEDRLTSNDWADFPAQFALAGIQAVMWTRTWPAEMITVWPVLTELAAEGIPTVSYHLDRWFGLDRAHQVDDQPFFRTSLVVSPDDSPLWVEHGVNHFWLPPGVYGPECEPVPPNPRRWPYDVVFVGSHPYPHPEWAKYRSDLLSAFSKAFRGRFGVLPRRGVPIRGRDLQELYATVPVVLGDSCLAGESHRYWSDRVPETLGRGGLLIHPLVDGMEQWYDGDELADHNPWPTDFMGYRLGDFAEAVRLAEWGIENLRHRHEAKAIREHGRATVLARDTYAHRMGTVLAVAEGIHGGYRDVHSGPWETVLACDVGHVFTGTTSEAGRPCSGPGCGKPLRISQESGGSDHLPSRPPGWERASPEVEREAGVSFSAPVRLPVKLHRWSAIFEPRVGTTDSEVIAEVWGTNDYRVPPEGFSGTVVDIGANVGAFSVLAAKAGAKRVVAFEPEAGNHERLVHHLYRNHSHDVVEPERMAVNVGGHSVAMVGEGGGARSVLPDEFSEGVPAVSLDELLRTIGTRGGIEFLKMDIEGGEYEAFAGCKIDAIAYVQTIALEFHGPAMPHLSHLDDDGKHLERWGALVAKLADAGRVETFGHPMRGGLIWWRRY